MNQTQNTENAILQAAEKLFKENGFTRTTTTAIAREAGVTHAMLHYYFRTKEQIFLQVLDGYVKEMHEDFKAVMKPGEDALTTIREVASRHFDFMEQHQGQMKVLLEVSEQQPEIIGRYREGFTRMASTAWAMRSGGSTSAKRTYPSPRGPKLRPGVQMTPALSIRSMQKSMLLV